MQKNTIFFLLLIFVSSCATKVPLNSSYFSQENAKKVGLLINVNKIGVARTGSQGLLEMVATPGNKFKIAVDSIENDVKPDEVIKKMYLDIFASKSKSITLIEEHIDFKQVPSFETTDTQKKYSRKNFTFLKEKYGFDEVLVADVDYGMILSYYSFAVINRQMYMSIKSEIVNLTDNSLIFKENSRFIADIEKEWNTPPVYENLKKSLKNAEIQTLELEKAKFNNSAQ